VTCIRLSHDDSEAISSSADGSCIIWNLTRGIRTNALFAATVFRSVVFHPDESQILTCGSDRKITYWDSSDCNAIRIMDGSSEEIKSLAIEPDGKYFVSGANDKLVKLWDYDEGTLKAVGAGHSGAVNVVQISPDQRRIVSVGAEGAIFFWTSPPELSKDYRATGYVPKVCGPPLLRCARWV
jgi:cilia- and flagella-associated protein 52